MPPADGFPTEEQYFAQHPTAPYSQYFDEKMNWKLSQAQAAWQQQQQLTAFHDSIVKQYPDFDAVLQEAIASGLRFAPQLSTALLRHNGVDWSNRLVRDPALATRLSQLAVSDPVSLGMELASLSRPVSAPTAQAPTPKTSAAPAPMQPVGSGTKTSAPSLDELADHGDDYDSSGYRERRAAERKAAGR